MPWLWLGALILDSVVSSGDDAEDSDAPENDAGQKDNAGQKNRTRKKQHAGQKGGIDKKC